MKLADPCESCPASHECWNYGYDKDEKRISWFECARDDATLTIRTEIDTRLTDLQKY